MAATKEQIKKDLYYGVGKGYSHMVMICDTFDYEDFVVYVDKEKDIKDVLSQYQGINNMYKIMEVYNYSIDLEEQLNQDRVLNYDSPNKKESQKNNNKPLSVKVLGSVSPYCKGDTNCPGFLVEDGINKIMLDCGNGVSRLLEFPDDLNNLNIIISHLHKDHYGDLLSIGYASYVYHKLGFLKERIPVYIPYESSPTEIREDGWAWSCGEVLTDFKYLTNFGDEHYLKFITYSDFNKIELNDINISFSLNPHPIKTYSIKIESPDGNLVYSGDTGYLGNTLEKFANNTDLLICEATFLKGQIRSENNHLFAYEAAEIARLAKVKKLLLMHFWPEIDKQKYVNEAKEIFENTEAAEEGKKMVLRK